MSVNDKLVIALQPRAILANVLPVSYILLLFNSPKGSRSKFAKYEKLAKYLPYCTWHRAISSKDNYLSCCFLKNADFTVKPGTHYIISRLEKLPQLDTLNLK